MNCKRIKKDDKNEINFRNDNILLRNDNILLNICTECDRTKTAKAAPGIGKL